MWFILPLVCRRSAGSTSAHCRPGDAHATTERLTRCLTILHDWMAANRLKLNPEKTEFIWLGTRHMLQKVESADIHVGDCCIHPSSTVKTLGVVFDDELDFNVQVNQVVKSGFYQLRQLRSVRRLLTIDSAKTLVNSFVCSKIDYCNSLYYGATANIHHKLQLLLNSCARLVMGLRKFDHVSDALKDLHWMRVPQRIKFKVASLARRSLMDNGPEYLRRYLTPVSSLSSRASLRSSAHGNVIEPRTHSSRAGGRGFWVSGPRVWNSLPQSIRNSNISAANFSLRLKTFLF